MQWVLLLLQACRVHRTSPDKIQLPTLMLQGDEYAAPQRYALMEKGTELEAARRGRDDMRGRDGEGTHEGHLAERELGPAR